MSETPKFSPAPEYGSDAYYTELQEQHDDEERSFTDAGWDALNASRPFYNNPATSPEGTTMTVADTATQSPSAGFDWFQIEGDTQPPEGMWNGRSVYEVQQGEWVRIKEERAGE